MRRLVSQWRQLARDYAAEFALSRSDLVFSCLLGTAAVFVALLDLVLFVGAAGGGR